jgi:hypothetical protein
VKFLHSNGFEIFRDLWLENDLYFGRKGNEVIELDKMFGSLKFKLNTDVQLLHDCATRILMNPINVTTFHHRTFLKSATDVIAIERNLYLKMKKKWLG